MQFTEVIAHSCCYFFRTLCPINGGGGIATADTNSVDYNVNVANSLNITLSTNNVVLDLNPNTKTSDAKDLGVTVKTNNLSGYKLTMSSTGDATDLVRDNTADGKNATIPTLSAAAGTTASSLSDNTWGYRVNNTGNFIPYVSGVQLMENTTVTNEDTVTLSFASKINYNQAAGTYELGLNLTGIATPVIYMQNMNMGLCDSTEDTRVFDMRDGKEYTVRNIGGTCWMTENLQFTGTPDDPAGTMTLNYGTSNVSSIYTASNPLTISYYNLSDNNDLSPRLQVGTDSIWYNFTIASANTINESTTRAESFYDICPAGWRLPNRAETIALVNSIGSSPSVFKPMVGGYYYNKSLIDTNNGYWWTSTADNDTGRYDLGANTVLGNGAGRRYYGFYIRCVMESRSLLSSGIVNMQDINPNIVRNTNTGDSKSLKDTRDNQTYTVEKIGSDLWMAKNLAIGCNGASFSSRTLTNSNSNLSATSWATPTTTYANSWNDPYITCNNANGAWYNYVSASAGTITTNSNFDIASSSVCPLGWELPSRAKTGRLVSGGAWATPPASFQITGGNLDGTTTPVHTDTASWWTSEATTNATARYRLRYLSSSNTIEVNTVSRPAGLYIRCIAK